MRPVSPQAWERYLRRGPCFLVVMHRLIVRELAPAIAAHMQVADTREQTARPAYREMIDTIRWEEA